MQTVANFPKDKQGVDREDGREQNAFRCVRRGSRRPNLGSRVRGYTLTDPNSPAEDEFAIPIGTNMEALLSDVDVEFDEETAADLRRRLDDFDEMRTRAYVESRSVHLGGPRGR